jgi:hypothetical protein
MDEAHRLEDWFEQSFLGSGEFDELKPIKAEGVFEKIGHDRLPTFDTFDTKSKIRPHLVSNETSFAKRMISHWPLLSNMIEH